MIELREILYGLFGAYRLCRLDPQGLAYFNASHAGFWRSFVAAAIAAPAYFLIVLFELGRTPVEASFERIVAIEALAYVILVFAYPLAMFYISRAIDRERHYMLYIVGYNWLTVPLALLELPAAALSAAEVIPAAAASVVELVVTLVTLVLLWFVARTALQISPLLAAALVAIDVTLTFMVRSLTEGRLGVG